MSARHSIDREALRGLIRQVLRDAVPADVQKKLATALSKKGGARTKAVPMPNTDQAEEISIASDGDLDRFVQRLLAMAEDGAMREALKSGQRKFRLAKSIGRPTAAPRPQQREETRRPAAAQSTGGNRIDKGLVAERHIVAAAKNGKRLTVARGVAVTPLARDKARQLGVVIERE